MRKILVIDDEPSVRYAIRAVLGDRGYSILEAAGGEEGLEIVRAEAPDLVLSDINMAGMDGFAVLRSLRSNPETCNLPVILMTGLPEKADVRFSMEQGADDYLAKPFGTAELIAAVRVRLERRDAIHAISKANEARLLELLSVTLDLIAIADPINGNLLYLNDAGRQMLVVSPQEDISKILLSDFMTAERGRIHEKFTGSENNALEVKESILIARDGRSIPVSEQILFHKPASGSEAFLSIVARDITERRRAEAELEKSHNDLLKASRQAGMAEVATGILHNVGNVLNSVSVASNCMASALQKTKASSLADVVGLLRRHEADLGSYLTADPKGKLVVDYLGQLSEHLQQEKANLLKEVGQVQASISHLNDIVKIQQNGAKMFGVTEVIQIGQLIEDALKLTAPVGRDEMQITKVFPDDLIVNVEKHKVLQILINLLRNARQACDASGNSPRTILIEATRADHRVRLSVSDNGVGIPPENLSRLFTHGFTTKKEGHGFGLHSATLAAKEMGGALLARSGGVGKGTTFTLELPINGRSNEAVPSTR